MQARRDIDDIRRAIDHLNRTVQWVQLKAGEDDLEAVTDALLLAMHDLRAVLARKKAERLMRRKAGEGGCGALGRSVLRRSHQFVRTQRMAAFLAQ